MKYRYVSQDEVARLLLYEEDHFRDFKSKDIKPGKLTRSVSAFANADGGDLYIGVSQSLDKQHAHWDGFENTEQYNGLIQCLEESFPLGEGFEYEFLRFSNKGYVLHVEVQKNRNIQKASDGKVYLRRGAQNLPQTTDEQLRRLKQNKGLISFEASTISCDIAEICYSDTAINVLDYILPQSYSPEKWLRKQRLIVGDNPTVAGVLLFADEPQAILPQRCGIKIYRYKTSGDETNRDTLVADSIITVEGSIYNQINDAVRKTKEIVEDIPKLCDEGIYTQVKYPEETLHEIITNAVLHRDYQFADSIHIRIFDNRIEVISPGRLPAHITKSNILDERFSRNGSLVRLINKFENPPNKDIGEGLNTAFKAMEDLRLRRPLIKELETSVKVTIPHERLASPEKTIIDYLSSHEFITNKMARQVTGVSCQNSMVHILRKLNERGLIEKYSGTQKPLKYKSRS